MDENPVKRLQHEDSENLLTPKEESDPESRDLALHFEAEREADQMSVEDNHLPIRGNLTNDSLLLHPLDLSLRSPEASESESESGSGSESESGSESGSESESENESDMEDIITEAYDNIEQIYDNEFVEVDTSNVTSLTHSPDMRHATQREFEQQESEQLEFEQQGSEQQYEREEYEQEEYEQQEHEQQEHEQQEHEQQGHEQQGHEQQGHEQQGHEQQEYEQEDIVPSPVADNTTPRPIDQSYCDLRTLSFDVTEEERIKRNEKLFETGTFFTREAYEAYTLFPPEVVDAELEHIIRLAEQRSNKRPVDQLIDEERQQQEVEYMEEDAEQPYETAESIHELQQQLELIHPAEIVPKIEPIDEVVPPLVTEEQPRKKQKTLGPTVLDTVLTDMLRYNRSQTTASEPSDLEIAAMAAGLDTSSQPSETTCSKFTKEDHVRFLRISEALKTGSTNLSESDIEMYKHMCTEIKREQDNFIKEQRKQICESGVYDVLDEKVEKMVQEYCENENMRLSQYPQFYKYFNLLQMPAPNAVADSSVLSFKHSLLQTGKIAACKASSMETPRRLDLFKKYIFTPPKESDEIDIEEEDDDDDDNDLYYKKKLPPSVSEDKNITQLIQNNDADIVISSECLIAIVELVHDISLDLYIPIKVVAKDNKKILIFDRPLPREEMTAREKNNLVYDVVFKSLCLDWPNRHDISLVPEGNIDKQNDQEENLQYNMWKFGDMNILIRHQIDGELIENATKKPGSKDRRVYLTSKLDYQIHQGREEIIAPIERSRNWLRSYVGGHATVIEGRIDVVNNRLVRIDRKEMVDIMGGQWRPKLESELLRHTFSKLRKMLLAPGNYLLQHKKDDRNFLIFQASEKTGDLDLSLKKINPTLIKSEKSYIPAWSAIENQIPWTFSPK